MMELDLERWVLWQDEVLLAVNKPAGIATLPEGWDPAAPHLKSLLEPLFGPLWIVHRLDKDTSGVVVLARTAGAHRHLNGQFERRQVTKIYHALASGDPLWEEQSVSLPLRTNAGRRHRTVVDPRTGKPAVTRLRILERFSTAALVEASPQTGRTHQIRAHLATVGHPILGDPLYGVREAADLAGIALDRLGLHALSLTCAHPETGEALTFTAPHPEDFSTALRQLRQNSE